MVDNGYDRDFAEAIFKQIEGFGEYGFPGKPRRQLRAAGGGELLAQVPRARLLPGGAARLAADGFLLALAAGAGRAAPRRRGAAGGCDGAASCDCTLEAARPMRRRRRHRRAPAAAPAPGQPAVRLGLRRIGGLSEAGAAAPAGGARQRALHQHRRPGPARRARRQGHGGAGRRRCADGAVGPSPPAGLGRHGAAPRAGAAQGRADPRARAAAAGRARRRGDRRRLRVAAA